MVATGTIHETGYDYTAGTFTLTALYEHASQQTGDMAVYRFFDTLYGTHFYTGDAGEHAGMTTPGKSTYRANLILRGCRLYAPAGTVPSESDPLQAELLPRW